MKMRSEIHYIPLTAIEVPVDRQRQEFTPKAIEELADSIEALGLLQPIVLRNDGLTLLAGERRYRALHALNERGVESYLFNDGSISTAVAPAVLAADLDEAQLHEAELHENLRRVALTWQEEAAAINRLHQLRKSRTDEKVTYSSTAEAISEMIGLDTRGAEVRDAEVLAEHLDDPDVAKASSAREARKIIDKKLAAEHRAKLAATYVPRASNHSIYAADALEWLTKADSATYHGIITDPPYGIGADDFGTQSTNRHIYEDSPDYALECYATLLDQGARICMPEAYLFAFCDIDHFPVLRQMAKECGWKTFRTPLIWHRGNSGILPLPTQGPRRTYEPILYCWRGERGLQTEAPMDVLSIPAVTRPTFGAEKPAELYTALLRWRARPADRILDPFAGSGPLLEAAHQLQCYATCVEGNEDKTDYMRVRLQELEGA